MAKPEDISQAIWQQARAAFVAYSKIEDASALIAIANGEYDGYPMISLTATAIKVARAEEREAIAAFLENNITIFSNKPADPNMDELIAAIRSRKVN